MCQGWSREHQAIAKDIEANCPTSPQPSLDRNCQECSCDAANADEHQHGTIAKSGQVERTWCNCVEYHDDEISTPTSVDDSTHESDRQEQSLVQKVTQTIQDIRSKRMLSHSSSRMTRFCFLCCGHRLHIFIRMPPVSTKWRMQRSA